MKRPGEAGFSVIELLVVLAILGIAGSVGLGTLAQARNRAIVDQAVQQLKADIARVRSLVRQHNTEIVLSVSPGTSPGSRGAYSWTVAGQTMRRALPQGVGLTSSLPAASSSITFSPPYGTVASPAATPTLIVSSLADTRTRKSLRVISIIGKVAVLP